MSGSAKILVVDDESVGRHLLEAILIPEGYSVIFGENGEEAVEKSLSEKPDIILCDVMMPKLDGFGVCKKLRANKDTAHIPIFLITALDDRDSRIRGIDAGADDYISKPFDRLEILAKVKNSNQLIRLRGTNNAEVKDQKDDSSRLINPVLFQALLNIIGKSSEDNNIDIYRSTLDENTKHLFSVVATNVNKYYILVSNHLSDINACIANLILERSLQQVIHLNDDNTPFQIIEKSLQLLKEIAHKEKINEFQNADYSLIIIQQNKSENRLLISGLNQIFITNSLNTSVFERNSKNNYQPFYLMGNQDIQGTGMNHLYLFSPNTFKSISQQEICYYLNATDNEGKEKKPEEIVQEKFNQIQDILIAKLIF